MKRKIYLSIILLFCLIVSCNINSPHDFDNLQGEYLGQTPASDTPVIFAPDIISTQYHEHSFPAISPDGNTILWNTNFMDSYAYEFPVKILSINREANIWTKADYFKPTALFESSGAIFSPQGGKIFFTVREQNSAKEIDLNIWCTEKTNGGWSTAYPVRGPINTDKIEGQVSVTNSETLYYRGHMTGVRNNYGIFRSRLKNGRYQKPEALPEIINSKELDWTPFIAPDESYLLFSSFREGGYGRGDIWISFRDSLDNWTKPQNLGPKINKRDNERFPYVSPDGKYLFYLTDRVDEKLLTKETLTFGEAKTYFSKPGNGQCDIYWVSAKIISEFKQTIKQE